MILKRKIYQRLLAWKSTEKGTTALLVEGARRVSKSFIIEEFAKNEYKSYIIIDFADLTDTLRDIFINDRDNLDVFFEKLSLYYRTPLYERQTLIIFDEVQIFPKAREMIKKLVKHGLYDYIETGSLLSLRMNQENILLPSEEDCVQMHPFDFEEFCWATGNEQLFEYIRTSFTSLTPLGKAIHRQAMDLFRRYMVVGGMPQAVVEYVKSGEFARVDIIKRRILKLYRDDVAKFAKRYENKVLEVFDAIPSQLTKHEKKFTFAAISKSARFREYEGALFWLDEAKIVNVCFNATDPSMGLKMSEDRLTLKLYMADTGLLVSHCFARGLFSSEELYRLLILDKLEINEGMFMENVVAQMLQADGGRELFFYSRFDRDDSEKTMEIDFLIHKGQKTIPVEVKSSKRYAYKSMKKFRQKFKTKTGRGIILHTADLRVSEDILFLPIYMAGLL